MRELSTLNLEQNGNNMFAKQVLQAVSWIRTSFVTHQIKKLDKVVKAAIDKAVTTTEVQMIIDHLCTEIVQCDELINTALQTKEHNVARAIELKGGK